jgi:hypothetical protein
LFLHFIEISYDLDDDLPRRLHQVHAVLGVDQQQTCGPLPLVALLTRLKQFLIMNTDISLVRYARRQPANDNKAMHHLLLRGEGMQNKTLQ